MDDDLITALELPSKKKSGCDSGPPPLAGIVRLLYVLGAIIWTILVVVLGLYATGTIGCLILLIPYLVFVVGFSTAPYVTGDLEDVLYQANYLALSLLLVLPLLAWINKDFAGDRDKFIQVIVLAIVLAMLSMIDVWVTRPWLTVVKHGKSILETMSISLLIFVLFAYYLESPRSILGTWLSP